MARDKSKAHAIDGVGSVAFPGNRWGQHPLWNHDYERRVREHKAASLAKALGEEIEQEETADEE